MAHPLRLCFTNNFFEGRVLGNASHTQEGHNYYGNKICVQNQVDLLTGDNSICLPFSCTNPLQYKLYESEYKNFNLCATFFTKQVCLRAKSAHAQQQFKEEQLEWNN